MQSKSLISTIFPVALRAIPTMSSKWKQRYQPVTARKILSSQGNVGRFPVQSDSAPSEVTLMKQQFLQPEKIILPLQYSRRRWKENSIFMNVKEDDDQVSDWNPERTSESSADLDVDNFNDEDIFSKIDIVLFICQGCCVEVGKGRGCGV